MELIGLSGLALREAGKFVDAIDCFKAVASSPVAVLETNNNSSSAKKSTLREARGCLLRGNALFQLDKLDESLA